MKETEGKLNKMNQRKSSDAEKMVIANNLPKEAEEELSKVNQGVFVDPTKMDIIKDLPRGLGYTISIANSKGGVGKTTNTLMLAHSLSLMGVKVLVVDADRQGNATKTLILTRRVIDGPDANIIVNQTFMGGIKEGSFKDSIVPIMDNLDLVYSSDDTGDFARYLYTELSDEIERDYLLFKALEEVKYNYDVVLIDSPPNNKEMITNISLVSDYIVVAYQPAESSLTGAEAFIDNLNRLKETPGYTVKVEILGILPTMVDKKSSTASFNMNYIKVGDGRYSEDDVFRNNIYLMERVRRYDMMGIRNMDSYSDWDNWDKVTQEVYQNVAIELIERLIIKELKKLEGD